MKKWMFVVVVGCLVLMTAAAQAQVDKMLDRFLQRGEARIRPDDLRILQLEVSPDPIQEGRWMHFRVTIANDSGQSGRISLILKDRDEIVSEVRDVPIYPRENRIDFPERYYRFSRTEHCFTVGVDLEHTRQRMDVSRDFCARRTFRGWTLSDRETGYLMVEDLDMHPDPAHPGQDVRFRVRLRNDGRSFRGTIRIQDKDQVVVQVEDMTIPRGGSEVQFPFTRYSFQRSDHCFTVVVDIDRTPYPLDAAKEFCAKPMGWTLRP